MVRNCSKLEYNDTDEASKYYAQYPYPLHNFQKWALHGIITGNHVLITAPTGSGKTLPGEFAATHLFGKGGKTIYCSPIKALSNQKFHDFSKKYPHISFGLITGDIKINSDADVLIMTTEILKTKLSNNVAVNTRTNFDIDIENELKCVVFDEIHMFNDEDRGHVWEQCLMDLPECVQIVGLSATLNSPERFATWIEDRYPNSPKIVYFTSRKLRAVPLTHYAFVTASQPTLKSIKDKAKREQVKNVCGTLVPLLGPDGVWLSKSYNNVNNAVTTLQKNGGKINCFHALNTVATFLTSKSMTPAICYVLSKKHLNVCADKMTVNLLEFDSKIPYTMEHECESIIRKLPNYKEYLNMPEYTHTVKLLQKGVGIHHAGMLPVLREMVEVLFAQGKIKMLFATETVAVGLNLPVKTTIFTDITKFDGKQNRVFKSHEYTQAAGRAGRLGIDDIGNVIHLSNLFRPISEFEYKQMMTGPPQTLSSKFRVSPNYILECITSGTSIDDIVNKIDGSSFAGEIRVHLKGMNRELYELKQKLSAEEQSIAACCTIPEDIIRTYMDLRPTNKVEKKAMAKIENMYSSIQLDREFKQYKSCYELKQRVHKSEMSIHATSKLIIEAVETIIRDMLINNGLVETSPDGLFNITGAGTSASMLHEVNCVAFAKLIHEGCLDDLSSVQLVQLFSCFTSFVVIDNPDTIKYEMHMKTLKPILIKVEQYFDSMIDVEHAYRINTGCRYDIHHNLIKYAYDWCQCKTEIEYKSVLSSVPSAGEFVKAMLNTATIAAEIEQVALNIGKVELAEKLSHASRLISNHIVTFQSLYV